MVFSVNQVRQFYVATSYNDTVTDASTVGTLGNVRVIPKTSNPDVELTPDKELYFLYKGADTVMKSDRIQLKNLNYIKLITPQQMRQPLKVVEVTLAADALSDSKPIVGQDYVLRINFRQFYGMSDQDQYIKDAAVHVTTGMTASQFYIAMMKSLNRAFSREVGATKTSNPYLKFEVYDTYNPGTGARNEARNESTIDEHTTATKLIITEKIQPWTRGLQAQERVFFDVFPTTIWINSSDVVASNSVTVVYEDKHDVIWGTATDVTPSAMIKDTDNVTPSPTYGQIIPNPALSAGTFIGNGTTLADMEWFYMGERADQYRMAGWPNYIPTTYMVDPTQEYYVIEIHYGFTDTGVNSYRSEKDITIVCTNSTYAGNIYNKICNAAGLYDIPNLKKATNDLKTAVLGEATSYSADTSLDSRVSALEQD